MSKKKILQRIVSLVLCFALLSAGVSASAEILTFETQYDYKKADAAWLTDLVIKEDMTTVGGLAERVTLHAAPEYPYTETAESFRNDVKYFTSLYTLNSAAAKAAYIMLFEVMSSGSGFISSDVNDEAIKNYLQNAGVTYPAQPGKDELLMARALYSAMITGVLSGDIFSSGTTLEAVLVNYIASLTGSDIETLKKWMPQGSVLSLDEYILAASRITLWTGGYNVTADTPADEVYRLVALMTINQQGITIDSGASFDEIKGKYTAVMLGKRYGVKVDSAKLGAAVKNDSAAFYMLQLIGRKNGLSVREDNCTYEEAFRLVAENSDIFDIEPGEFYADIPEYDAYLKNKRSSIWVYPTAYVTNLKGFDTVITVDGKTVKNNYFTEVPVSPDVKVDELIINVSVSSSSYEKSSFTYKIRIHQGENIVDNTEVTEPGTEKPEISKPDTATSDSIVNDMLASLGLDSSIMSVVSRTYDSLPPEISNMIPYLAPTFESSELYPELNADNGPVYTDESYFIGQLDKLGASFGDIPLEGMPGLDFAGGLTSGDGINKFITFG